jgi:hypothetical protein
LSRRAPNAGASPEVSSVDGCAHPRGRRLLSWSWVLPRRSAEAMCTAVWVQQPLRTLCARADPSIDCVGSRGLPHRLASHGPVRYRGRIAPSELPLLQSMTIGRRPPLLVGMPGGASHEVSGSFSTTHLDESTHISRVCLTRYVPPSGFHALLAACSSPGSRPCFVPERSWSSLPFRAFPTAGAVTPLDVLLPSCRSPSSGPRARALSRGSARHPA